MLDKTADPLYNLKAVKNAAIAQSVERILGKDEVASSNLASSSIFLDSISAAIAQSVERILGKDEVASSNLASSSKAQDHLVLGFLYISKSLSTASRRTSLRTSAAALVWQSVNPRKL